MTKPLKILLLLTILSCNNPDNLNSLDLPSEEKFVVSLSNEDKPELKNNERIEHTNFMTCVYESETLKWCGFNFDYQYLFPRKGHNIFLDSAYVVIPYENGNIWYEGKFIKNAPNYHSFYGQGIHYIRNSDGTLKGIIDFTTETINRISDTGKNEEFSFEDFVKIEPHLTLWWKKEEQKY